MLTSEKRYYQFVREERLFCAVLASLLIQRGSNLAKFLELINGKLAESGTQIAFTDLEQAEVYIEFAFLRDYWNGLKDNTSKREYIFRLLSQVDSLAHYHSTNFDNAIPRFNSFFMDAPDSKRLRGMAIQDDIVYPGQWSIAALDARFSDDSQFQDFCCFKWAFNIKPDVVLLIPGSKPLCIEAKLESKEGCYPASASEGKIFDRRFGPQRGRVMQLELQRFMFEKLLRSPCQQVVIARDRDNEKDQHVVFLSWVEVFQSLNKDGSIPFVRSLIERNVHLNSSKPV